jgi:hypothetical protein
VILIKKCSICCTEKELSEFYSYEKESKKKGKYIYYQPYCKECTIKKSSDYQKENPEVHRKSNREWARIPKNLKKIKERHKIFRENGGQLEWQRNNKDKLRKYNSQHRIHDVSDEEWENCKNYFNYRCGYCGILIEDHFVPFNGEIIHSDFHKEHVRHDGENDLSNCIPSCKSCNCSKWTYSLEEWYNENNKNYSEERLIKIIKWTIKDHHKYINKT